MREFGEEICVTIIILIPVSCLLSFYVSTRSRNI